MLRVFIDGDGVHMQELLTHTDSLFNHIYWFKQDFSLSPKKDHIGTAISWTDIAPRDHDFIRELINTVVSWVYSKSKAENIINERLEVVGKDFGNAAAFLATQAFSKFRPSHPQGQFGELLLFNFIQHFFKAVPLLRKQRITTSIGHERYGADAVHYKKEGPDNIFLLGESKCYESKYQFKKAFEISLSSIVSTVKNFNKELNLYVYDDFIEPELEEIAKQYKANTLKNVHFELVCLVAYNENKIIDGKKENEIKKSIENIVHERCKGMGHECYSEIDSAILTRINYIIFPIWGLDKLLEQFQNRVGAE